MSIPNLYEVLGVPRDATTAAIKTAFRRKAKNLHPDVGGDPEQFRLVRLACDVLTDPERRRNYDQTGAVSIDGIADHPDAKVYAAIADLLTAVLPKIKSPNFDDVVVLLRDAVAQILVDIDRRAAELNLSVEKLAVIANRVQATEGENLLRSIVSGRREALLQQRKRLEHDRQLYEEARDFLGGYEYFTAVENVLISSDVWPPR
jgi:curved DNA-binding protein CbpA